MLDRDLHLLLAKKQKSLREAKVHLFMKIVTFTATCIIMVLCLPYGLTFAFSIVLTFFFAITVLRAVQDVAKIKDTIHFIYEVGDDVEKEFYDYLDAEAKKEKRKRKPKLLPLPESDT